MNAHTPGPWNYSTSQEGWSFDIYQAEDAAYTKESSDVATLFVRSVKCDPKETQEANARLIAAAPDLLEALQNLENDDGAIPSHAWDIVKSAIRKATK